MSLRFSDAGPAFPPELVDALLDGDVVFLCGAGVSAPQLPGFGGLVQQCFDKLNVEMDAAEQVSFDQFRFEEVLGSLGRRIVDPDEVVETVTQLLQPPENVDLTNHRTVLRLSRDRENRPMIVTTNFDTLIERALLELLPSNEVGALSFSGQALPAPGSRSFGGIIHLHGRIEDGDVEVDATPLVMTSSEYGDAYMRSAWASRFLFDLARCKTIVLAGYSAGDAPVRYFLNVLEADRERFPDLRTVYAFDGVRGGEGEADARWEVVAVRPLPYNADADPENDLPMHAALWRDLAALAELIEKPKATRRAWAGARLAAKFSDASVTERDQIAWLYGGKRDLWDVAIQSTTDPAWFEFFESQKLWSATDAAWVVPAWIAQDWASVERFEVAVRWFERLGRPFRENIAQRLRQANELPELWLRAWRLFTISNPKGGRVDFEDKAFNLQNALAGPVVLARDLEKAVELLTPVASMAPNRDALFGAPPPAPPARLRDIASTTLSVGDDYGANELLGILRARPEASALMAIATERFRSVTALSVDFERIGGDYDANDFSIPSVEDHAQNQFHDGVTYLVRLLADLIEPAGQENAEATRGFAESWRALPGIVGVRLWLHALRNTQVYGATDALNAVLELDDLHFWDIRRELAMVLRERSAAADLPVAHAVEARILNDADNWFGRYEIEEGQADWRSHARDAEVWLRLNMLGEAGVLSEAGVAELTAIKARREYLDRDVIDSDFFGSYSTGIRSVRGDPQPIVEAAEDDRLRVAQETLQSHDLDIQQGWSAFCRSDPVGAFDTLSNAPLNEANARLWRDLLNALAFGNADNEKRNSLLDPVFTKLATADDDFLARVIVPLADVYFTAPRAAIPETAAWWNRLFGIAQNQPSDAISLERDLFDEAINTPTGRLAETVLRDIDTARKEENELLPDMVGRLQIIANAAGPSRHFGLAILARETAFVLSITGETASDILHDRMSADTDEGAALRAILVSDTSPTSSLTKKFGALILQGVKESIGSVRDATRAAAKLLGPALTALRAGTDGSELGITIAEARDALRRGSPTLREGAVQCLHQWLSHEENPAEFWRTGIAPLLKAVWPRERALRETALTKHFAAIAVAAGDAFPEAFTQLKPYLVSPEGRGALFHVKQSQVPEKFPIETLSLIWILCGANYETDFYELGELLDRLIKADKAIELDRRLQALEMRTFRFG